MFQRCPFRRACINGDLDKVSSMIENNPSLERVVDKSGLNGFHHAAAEGQVKVLEFLTGIRFDVNAKTSDNETPILLAARNGQYDAVDFLLKNGADPLITSKINTQMGRKASRNRNFFSFPERKFNLFPFSGAKKLINKIINGKLLLKT